MSINQPLKDRVFTNKRPLQNIGLILIAGACLLLGLIGLIIPIIPGVVFLFIAAGLLAQLSPTVRHNLDRHPRMSRFFRRLDSSSAMGLYDQCKMTFFASLEAITRPTKRL